MADYPLLVLPPPEVAGKRSKLGGGGAAVHGPGPGRQAQRLGPRLDALAEQFDKRAIALRTEATGVEPESVIVLEIVGSVDDFVRAVREIPGLEWLGEEALESGLEPDDDFFVLEKGNRTDKPVPRRLFMVFSNQTAFNQILELWKTYQDGKPFPRRFAPWRNAFEQLHDIRRWSAQDRIAETGVLEDWNDLVKYPGAVRCEIELWHRGDPALRRQARTRVERAVTAQSGSIKTRCEIPEIAYHALIAELPRRAVAPLLEDPEAAAEIELLQCDDLQFVRPLGQALPRSYVAEQQEPITLNEREPSGAPISALLDGLPLQNHEALQGRLIVDDPDGFEENYPAHQRGHGTSMASIMVNGDLSQPSSLARPIYVRPLLRPNWAGREEVPEDVLVVDLLHRAVRRMKEGDGKEPPAAPEVCIINLSIGIRGRPFHTSMSPLARLIDWLSWRYRILFLVSAGNHLEPIRLEVPKAAFVDLPATQQRELILRSIFGDARLRRLLSPAEAMNAMTVGALHSDVSDADLPVAHVDPIDSSPLPSLVTALGLGYRRSIKPDLLATGGRVPVAIGEETDGSILLHPYTGTLPPGVKAAAPSPRMGEMSGAVHARGTSIACAFASHWATRLYDVIEDLREGHATEIDRVPRALWIKALLVHATHWQPGHDLLKECFADGHNSRKLRELSSRFLGYGGFDPARAAACAYHRATAVSSGILRADEKRTHRFPLPPSLAGKLECKRLAITLAWFSPINPSHQKWRRADLWFEAKPSETLKVVRNGSDHHAVRRGTVQHEIYDGADAAVFVDGDTMAINVNCKAGATELKDPVPYTLAVTLEVNEGVKVPIYEEVRVRIRQRVPIQPSS